LTKNDRVVKKILSVSQVGAFDWLERNNAVRPPKLHILSRTMARHKKLQAPENDEPGLDISSLIDVCFLLLIYFLVTTQIVKKEQELSTIIPSINPEGLQSHLAPMSIHLEANGHVSIKNESGLVELIETNPGLRELPSLLERLKLHKDAAQMTGEKPLVKISVDGDTLQQRVTDVFNALAGAEITEFTFADLNHPGA
jgi:biopolymer transport protein ExbD